MSLALLVLRALLGAVFGAAGLAKLLDRTAGRRLLETFELGAWAKPALRLLPLAEIALAWALLVSSTARPAACAAAAMLVAFSMLLVRSARRGHEGSCNCFGALAARLTSRHPLGRNAALLAVALLVAGFGPGSPVAVLWRHHGVDGAVLAALAALAVAAFALAGASALPRRRAAGEIPGARELVAGARRTFVLFVEARCAACRSVAAALERFDGTAAGVRLVVVSSEPLADTVLARVARSADRHVVDSGGLAGRYGISATPTLLVLGRRGAPERFAVGAEGVTRLLDSAGLGPARGSRRAPAGGPQGADAGDDVEAGFEVVSLGAISRRRLVALGLGAAVTLPGFHRLEATAPARRRRVAHASTAAASARAGVACPSCGSCVICSATSGSSKLSCRPCSQHCSGHKLCASFANEYAPFTTLASYLRGKGFAEKGAPLTYGLNRDGKLVVLSGATTFAGGPAATPQAVLIYSLTNAGESAWVAFRNARGVVTSVATVVGTQVVRAPVGPPAAVPAAGNGRHRGAATADFGAGAAALASPYSCADVCSFALGVAAALLTLPATVVASPEIAALGFAASLFAGGLGLANTAAGAVAGGALAALLPLTQAATTVSALIEGVTSFDNALGQTAFCEHIACKMLKFCCTSNGVCVESDAQCEHDCPGGLAHPMSHCNAYLDGKIVSTLISP